MNLRFGTMLLVLLFFAACHKKKEEDLKEQIAVTNGPETPTQYETLDIQTLVGNAYNSGASSVTIPAGTWLVNFLIIRHNLSPFATYAATKIRLKYEISRL